MVMEFLHGVFAVIKFIFGLGALATLIGIGLVLLWFALRLLVHAALRNQPADHCPRLRKFFLESTL
jgi:hypothetical protein